MSSHSTGLSEAERSRAATAAAAQVRAAVRAPGGLWFAADVTDE